MLTRNSHLTVDPKMAGAGKKRAKNERQAGKGQASHGNGSNQPPAPEQLSGMSSFDGPGESSSGAPTSRGRSGSQAPPSVGQPQQSQSARSQSHTRSSSQARGTSSNLLPDRTANRFAARFIDLPGNAYVYGGLQDKVSDVVCHPQFL